MVTLDSWFIWALLSALFAAFTAIFAKVGIQNIDADLAALIRTVILTGILAVFILVTGKWSNPWELSAKNWLFLGLSGLSTGASWVCYFRALQIGDVSQVSSVDKLSLGLVAIFALVFLGEKLSVMEWVGVALVSIGVLVLAIK
jgi:bacterial/archaeal transporter family protein